MRNIACMLLVLWEISSPANAQPAQEAPAIPVGVITAERKPVTKSQDFVGRVEAVERVEVKARITGYLEKVAFKEGDLIKEGAPLYSIEKGLFEAAVGQAEGALEKNKAAKTLTEVQLQRAEELLAKGSGTRLPAIRRLPPMKRPKVRFSSTRPICRRPGSTSAIPKLCLRLRARSARPTLPKAMSFHRKRARLLLSSARIRCM